MYNAFNNRLPNIIRNKFNSHWQKLQNYSRRPWVRIAALGALVFIMTQKEFSFSVSIGGNGQDAAAGLIPVEARPVATRVSYIEPETAKEKVKATKAVVKTTAKAAAAKKNVAPSQQFWWETARDHSQNVPVRKTTATVRTIPKVSNAPSVEDYLNLANPATAVSDALSPAQKQKAATFSNLGFVLNPHLVGKNDPAVVAAKNQAVADYIRKYLPAAQEEARIYNVPVSITLGQGLLESNAGASKLASRDNNHFGIKCKSKCIGCRCANYTDDSRFDMFRIFENAAESFREHSLLLTGGRYKHLLLLSRSDYKNWAHGLKAAGYATDPKYGDKLISIIEALQLHKYDR
jgi:flagellum-specific peptidoglycan hydrolase FlgJ